MPRYASRATQCTAPNGEIGCFLWEGPTHDLNFRFIGPRDARKLASPIFRDSVALFDHMNANRIACEPGLMGRAILA